MGKSGGDGQGSTQILGWGLWRVLGRSCCSKGLLGGVDHVEETILVLLALVDLGDGRGHAHHAVPVHQQEEGLVGVELQASPGEGAGEGGDRGQTDKGQSSVTAARSEQRSREWFGVKELNKAHLVPGSVVGTFPCASPPNPQNWTEFPTKSRQVHPLAEPSLRGKAALHKGIKCGNGKKHPWHNQNLCLAAHWNENPEILGKIGKDGQSFLANPGQLLNSLCHQLCKSPGFNLRASHSLLLLHPSQEKPGGKGREPQAAQTAWHRKQLMAGFPLIIPAQGKWVFLLSCLLQRAALFPLDKPSEQQHLRRVELPPKQGKNRSEELPAASTHC